MTTLIEFEKVLVDDGYPFTTFKECSVNKRDDGTVVYVSENEEIAVFNVDHIKDSLSKERFKSPPSSVDAMWIDHDKKVVHIVEFKDVKAFKGTKKKEIRLNLFDTLLLLNKEYELFSMENFRIVFLVVRKFAKSELSSYHVRSKANLFRPAYLEYIEKLTGIKMIELKQEDFERYIENSDTFLRI